MSKESREIIIALIAGTSTLLLLGVLMISFLILYRSRHRKLIREREQLKLSYERELLKSQLEIQEQTFRHISQEIHDNIGQMLSLARLNISTMDPTQPTGMEQKISDSKKLVSQAIYDLRNLSHGLNTDYVADMGLARAIEHELEMIRKSSEQETVFQTEGDVYRLDKQREVIIYRIVQETLNNILKHAASRKIIIHLHYRPEEITLTITDNGKGFDLTPLDLDKSFGLGIKNMHNRARLMGARFQISSTLGEGTSVLVNVPVANT
ncbi:MAG TPA: ATP-binding protein [Puia sp.]|nr:ATP-binding protein [Puia sp.]